MHRFGAGIPARIDDAIDQQIALAARRGTDVHRLVGHAHVQRICVGVRIDRDRADPEPLSGADHAARNFSAIGNEDGSDHETGGIS